MTIPPADSKEQIKQAVSVLKNGGVIVFPTDTVYGLGAGIKSPLAIKRIFSIKNRPLEKALPLLAADLTQLQELFGMLPEVAKGLAEKYMPGALTLVLPAPEYLPPEVTSNGTVAVRVSAHPMTAAIIRGLGYPITGTSANLSGQPSALTAEEASRQVGQKVDFILDGGRCTGGTESTIVDVSGKFFRLIREGAISRQEIEHYLPLE